MKTIREFVPADRYAYDFGLCSYKNGFAQIDTSQDASYFGTWANPTKRIIFTYCEGDTTMQEAETDTEFVNEIRLIKKWNIENGHEFLGIDAMCDSEIETAFRKLGLGNLLH